MSRHLTWLAAFALSVCAGCSDTRSNDAFHEIGRFHAPNMHADYPSAAHFVVAASSVMRERTAVLAYSRRLCPGEEQVCSVLYWTDASRAARGFPVADREAEAIVASYNRNRSTGHDGFQCYDFGSPSERCTKLF